MASLDPIMEAASTALVRMDYLTCESLCLQALAQARQQHAWDYYARILLPLQEARRQRRMIAAEGAIRLGTAAMTADDQTRLASLPAGCVVITRPSSGTEAQALARQARTDRRFFEILFADNEVTEPRWTLRAFERSVPEAGAKAVSCVVEAPPREWVDRWLEPNIKISKTTRTPGDWFIDATEALGDAALAQLATTHDPAARIEQLEACVNVVTDHEIIHQQLAAAARAMAVHAGSESGSGNRT